MTSSCFAGLDAGADDYLTKPFAFGEMLARLRALTRRHGDAATRLAVGSLVIDTARHRAQLGETDLPLTAREFDFLAHLARHAGHVVSRPDLMAVVWEDARRGHDGLTSRIALRGARDRPRGGRAPNAQARIFDRFVRAEHGREAAGGGAPGRTIFCLTLPVDDRLRV